MPSSTSSSNRRRVALRLLFRVGLFSLLIGAATPIVTLGAGLLGRSGRMGTSHDKQVRLQEAPPPRLILVGGSSLQYGIDSPRLEEQLDVSVVNLGIQASIGLGYGVRQAVAEAQPGDTVLVVAESAAFWRVDPNGESALYSMLGVNPAAHQYLNRDQWLRFPKYAWQSALTNIHSGEVDALGRLLGRHTFRQRTNAWGDYLGHEGKTGVYEVGPEKAPVAGPVRKDVVHLLEQLVAQSRLKGVQPLISFAPIAASAYDDALATRIVSALHGMPVVGEPADFRYPDASFYDTQHHLLFDVRADYVDRLAALLAEHDVGRTGRR